MNEIAKFVATLFGFIISIIFIGGFVWSLFHAFFTPFEKKNDTKPKDTNDDDDLDVGYLTTLENAKDINDMENKYKFRKNGKDDKGEDLPF